MYGNKFHSRRRVSRPRRTIGRYLQSLSKQWTIRNITITVALSVLAVCSIIVPLLNGIFAPSWLSWTRAKYSPPPRCQTLAFTPHQRSSPTDHITNTSVPLYHAFPPTTLDDSPLSAYRRPDTVDTFANYTYRTHPSCSLSSLDLHRPFSPLCPDRASFLDAFSGGGRIGFDAPFMPRKCDMRWYTTFETCEILSRFEKVIFVGDSMMRHVVGALNVLLREDLGYGAVTGWNFDDEETEKCFCMHQMDVKACSVQGVYRTSDVLSHDPDSFKCPKLTSKVKGEDGKTELVTTSPVNLIIELMLKFPHDPTEVKRFKELLPKTRPTRPIAFVLGHGLWNDLDLQATVNWLNGVLNAIYEEAPYLRPETLPREAQPQPPAAIAKDTNPSPPSAPPAPARNKESKQDTNPMPMSHILFITPNAAGPLKPDAWIQSQGDKALQLFEKSAHNLIHRPGGMFYGRGIEHMGTWNMSIQMEKWDGVHLDLRGNLVKAMGVVNWLGGVEVEVW